jgi:hypothetical protein
MKKVVLWDGLFCWGGLRQAFAFAGATNQPNAMIIALSVKELTLLKDLKISDLLRVASPSRWPS